MAPHTTPNAKAHHNHRPRDLRKPAVRAPGPAPKVLLRLPDPDKLPPPLRHPGRPAAPGPAGLPHAPRRRPALPAAAHLGRRPLDPAQGPPRQRRPARRAPPAGPPPRLLPAHAPVLGPPPGRHGRRPLARPAIHPPPVGRRRSLLRRRGRARGGARPAPGQAPRRVRRARRGRQAQLGSFRGWLWCGVGGCRW